MKLMVKYPISWYLFQAELGVVCQCQTFRGDTIISARSHQRHMKIQSDQIHIHSDSESEMSDSEIDDAMDIEEVRHFKVPQCTDM